MLLKEKYNQIKAIIGALFYAPEPVHHKKLPENTYMPELVMRGHVWVARMNHMVRYRNLAVLAVVATLSFDLIMNIPVTMLASTLASSTPATFGERWLLSPVQSMKKAFSSDAPNLSYSGKPADSTDDIETATDTKDLPGYIKDNLDSLNKSNKLAYSCDQNWDIRKSWAFKGAFNEPKCKVLPGAVWIGSFAQRNQNYKQIFGVFRKVDDEYRFFNVTAPGGYPTYQIEGYPTTPLNNVPRAIAKAFPELLVTK